MGKYDVMYSLESLQDKFIELSFIVEDRTVESYLDTVIELLKKNSDKNQLIITHYNNVYTNLVSKYIPEVREE